MANSAVTENALANSLKKLMRTHSINHIHVKMITDDCGCTRHTFYNHFHDVYELLGWMYNREIIEGVDRYCTLDQWKKGLQLILEYTADNRHICLNTFHSLGRDHLEAFLYRVFYRFLKNVIDDISENMRLSEEIRVECCEFYANALIGIFISWLKRDLRETPQQILRQIDRMISGNIVFTLKKFDENK